MRHGILLAGSVLVQTAFYCVPMHAATFTVPDGDVAAFEAAVLAANATSEEDTIALASHGDYPFTGFYPTSNPLDRTALPPITTPIVIEGNASLIHRSNIAGPVQQFRLIRVSATGNLTLRSVTIRNGDLGAVNGDFSDSNGSALRNDGGILTVWDCRFDNNHNTHWTAGIFTTGPTVISGSRFIKNTSIDGGTGAIRGAGTGSLLIEKSHFSQNSGDDSIRISDVKDAEISQCSMEKAGGGAVDFGRGIEIGGGSTVNVVNCTITDGSSVGIHIGASDVTVTHCTITLHGQANRPGRGISMGSGTLRLRNSILAFNDQGPAGFNKDCEISGGSLLQNTANLIKDGSTPSDFLGDPQLGPLGFYGSNTKVFPLVEGSVAIDHGNDFFSAAVDQRGVARPIGAHADLGAYEGSIPDERKWTRVIVDLIYREVPYIIICDPLGPDSIVVAVAGSRTVPVRSIIPASLTMGNAGRGSARVLGVRDLDRDGADDLILEFRVAEVYRGVFSCEDVTMVELQGRTVAGQAIFGWVEVAGQVPR